MPRNQILSVNVEDYFHVWAIRSSDTVRRKHWARLDSRLEASLDSTLRLLREHDAKATFFVFGCIADAQPDLVARIVADGHEVGSRGYWPRGIKKLGRAEFVDELELSRVALERAGANRIVGYRSPVWLKPEHLWMLDALAEAGYKYDSSVNPILRRFEGASEFTSIHAVRTPKGLLWEFPITTASVLGLRVAVSGGNYIRQLPHALLSRAVTRQVRADREPVVFYFMPWELDPEQPEISGLSITNSLRQYRNLAKTRTVFEEYLSRYKFHGIADELRIEHPGLAPNERPSAPPEILSEPMPQSIRRREASLVIPIFNEEQNVRYLYKTLAEFRRRLSLHHRLFLVLVDDASTDSTWKLLNEHFGGTPDTKLVRHQVNRGVAAAILTGVQAATTEIVASIDCDCSYDPMDLAEMLPLIDHADLVTASPYHPSGKVLNVPRWRLFLSKTLSRMYSTVLGERMHTYTSCCRVYRKERLAGLKLKSGGFLGVAETLIEVRRRGGRVVEYPATLESRLFGESKMKIARTIGMHLTLLTSLAAERMLTGTLLREETDVESAPPESGVDAAQSVANRER